MSSIFVAPATLRDVPRVDAAEAYPQDHPALIVPATDDAPAYEMSYATLAAAVTAVGKQLIPLLPTGKDEQVRECGGAGERGRKRDQGRQEMMMRGVPAPSARTCSLTHGELPTASLCKRSSDGGTWVTYRNACLEGRRENIEIPCLMTVSGLGGRNRDMHSQ